MDDKNKSHFARIGGFLAFSLAVIKVEEYWA